jgi:hypothetical protein
MLTQDQIDLIHHEIDGVNSPEASAAFHALVEGNPDAAALVAELRYVAAVLGQVQERAPRAQLKQAILDAVDVRARTAPRSEAGA